MSIKKDAIAKLKEYSAKKDEDPFVHAHCEECGWKGKPEDCETYEESEGWEYPSYTVAICPECSKKHNEEEGFDEEGMVAWYRKSTFEKMLQWEKEQKEKENQSK